MNRTRSAVLLSGILLLLDICMTGCVYTYISSGSVYFDCDWRDSVLRADNGVVALDTIWIEKQSDIFYPRDFSFSTRHGDGDWFYYWIKEPLCRLPTIWIELPFLLMNLEQSQTAITIPSHGDAVKKCLGPLYGEVLTITNALDSVKTGVMLVEPVGSDKKCVKLTYSRKMIDEGSEVLIGVVPVFRGIFFTGQDECYVMRNIGSRNAHNLSFCGITIDEPVKLPFPFLWRIDLRTGERDLIAYYDGKIKYTAKGDVIDE